MNILKREDAQTIANILNGKQKLLVMKKAPKNGEGCWWYLYCSKGKDKLITFDKYLGSEIVCGYDCTNNKKHIKYGANDILNGKVVARFWCDKVEEIDGETDWLCRSLNQQIIFGEICKRACLEEVECYNYLNGKNGFAIHISKLEIFDEPRGLSEFHKVGYGEAHDYYMNVDSACGYPCFEDYMKEYKLTKAPQNYCYVEGE